MRKVGIRLLLSLILLTAIVVTAAAPVSAAKPVRLGINITCICDGSITVNYWWDKIGAHYYTINIYKIGEVSSLNSTGLVDLQGRTPKKNGHVTLTSPDITCGHTYRVSIRLYRNHIKPIHGAYVYSTQVYFDYPPPSIFAEDFCGVPQGSLPEGWFTDNSTLVGVCYSHKARGLVPELYMDYGWPESDTQDYYVRTPAIDATAITTLNLTFKHYLDIYNWAQNFTYSIEVSKDGSPWLTVFEETPNEDNYPYKEIGPETLSYDLSAYAGNHIYIRWRLREYTWYSNGWYIDDVCLNGA